MDYQKELNLKTGEEVSIHFDVFTGTDGYSDEVKEVMIGNAFDIYFLVEGDTTLPLRITIQKQIALALKGERVYRDFGDPELIMVEYSDKVYGLEVSPSPIFDRLIVSSADGIGGDTVHVLLKIL
jgi:hypothetical protein